MKILKNNCEEQKNIAELASYPRVLICEQCQSELEYDEPDLRMGALGCMYLNCPCCGRDNMLEENENKITLTKDNIVFPTHFFHTSAENGAVDTCNEKEVKKCIEQAINYFRKNKKEFAWSSRYGNLYVCVYRYDGDEEYEVIVGDDYYSTYIPFETEDYN